MAGKFSFTGWTTQAAVPGSLASRAEQVNATAAGIGTVPVGQGGSLANDNILRSLPKGTIPSGVDPVAWIKQKQAEASRGVSAVPIPALDIGALNAVAQNLATANQLIPTDTSGLTDKALGSRGFVNPAAIAPQSVAIQTSPYRTADVPGFLQQSIADLNQNQSLRRALQAEWMDRLFGLATAPAPSATDLGASQNWAANRQAAWNALMAASVQPGAAFSYTPPSAPGRILVRGGGSSNIPRDQAVNTVASLSNQIQNLEKQRQNLYQAPTPIAQIYEGSERQRLDSQIQDLRAQQARAASLATLATRGWTPGMPSY